MAAQPKLKPKACPPRPALQLISNATLTDVVLRQAVKLNLQKCTLKCLYEAHPLPNPPQTAWERLLLETP